MISRRTALLFPVLAAASLRKSPAFAQAVSGKAMKLLAAARSQIGVTTAYDPAYVAIDYPNGDVGRERGVCTDVVVRAYRDAFEIDLQELVHEDMAQHFAAYPKNWGLKRPDRNIDHRRVPNLRTFFSRHGAVMRPMVSKIWPGYEAGDLVTVKLPGNLDHIGIVSDRIDEKTKLPLAIHNIGRGTQEDDILFQFQMTGRYRYAL